jgi:hypothetical protein
MDLENLLLRERLQVRPDSLLVFLDVVVPLHLNLLLYQEPSVVVAVILQVLQDDILHHF